jgi:hypothetical protein
VLREKKEGKRKKEETRFYLNEEEEKTVTTPALQLAQSPDRIHLASWRCG